MKAATSYLRLSPQTRPGFWSVWLEAAFALMFILNIFVNIYLIGPAPFPAYYVAFILFMLVCGLMGGLLGLFAIIRQHEHSPIVRISTLVGMFAIFIILNELVQGIQYMLAL